MNIKNRNIKEVAPFIKFKNDFNFAINSNSSLLITGVNGIGKSTLLDYIYESYQTQYKIFYLTQELIKFNNVNIEQLVSIIGQGYSYKQSPFEVMEYLKLNKKHSSKFNRLSGGQKQKVMIAIAFSCDVDLLLFDEPLNNLDESSIQLFNQLVEDSSVSMLIISHFDLQTDREVILDV